MEMLIPTLTAAIEFLNRLNTTAIFSQQEVERSGEIADQLSEQLKQFKFHNKLFETSCTFYPEAFTEFPNLPVVGTEIVPCAAWEEEDGQIMYDATSGEDVHTVYIRLGEKSDNPNHSVADFPTVKGAEGFEQLLRNILKLDRHEPQVYHYILPEIVAGYLINADASGLTEKEIAEIDNFVKKENITIIEVKDDSRFCHTNDLNQLGGNCLTFVAHKLG